MPSYLPSPISRPRSRAFSFGQNTVPGQNLFINNPPPALTRSLSTPPGLGWDAVPLSQPAGQQHSMMHQGHHQMQHQRPARPPIRRNAISILEPIAAKHSVVAFPTSSPLGGHADKFTAATGGGDKKDAAARRAWEDESSHKVDILDFKLDHKSNDAVFGGAFRSKSSSMFEEDDEDEDYDIAAITGYHSYPFSAHTAPPAFNTHHNTTPSNLLASSAISSITPNQYQAHGNGAHRQARQHSRQVREEADELFDDHLARSLTQIRQAEEKQIRLRAFAKTLLHRIHPVGRPMRRRCVQSPDAVTKSGCLFVAAPLVPSCLSTSTPLVASF